MTDAPAQPDAAIEVPDLEIRIFLQKGSFIAGDEPMFLLRQRAIDGLWEFPGGILKRGSHFTQACQECLEDDHGITDVNRATGLRAVQTMIDDGSTTDHTVSLPFLIADFDGEPVVASPEFIGVGWFRSHQFPTRLTHATRMLLQQLPKNRV
jgi:hypothetical protein